MIRIRRSNSAEGGGDAPDADNEDNFLIIDEKGVTIKTAGRLNFDADQDILFKTPGRITLDCNSAQVYTGEHIRPIRKSLRQI